MYYWTSNLHFDIRNKLVSILPVRTDTTALPRHLLRHDLTSHEPRPTFSSIDSILKPFPLDASLKSRFVQVIVKAGTLMATARSLVRPIKAWLYYWQIRNRWYLSWKKKLYRGIGIRIIITRAHLTVSYCIIHEELLFYKSARFYSVKLIFSHYWHSWHFPVCTNLSAWFLTRAIFFLNLSFEI